jgi:hypothetical protein
LTVDAIDHQVSPLLTLAQRFLRPFSVINVGDQHIPVENSPLAVAQRNSACLKPPVFAIEPAQSILKIKWLAFRDRISKHFDRGIKIVGVNNIVHPPIHYLFRRLAEILQKRSVENFRCPIGRKPTKQAGHVVQQQTRIKFSRLQGFLGLLAIVNVSKE